ncbi:MAG TPA: hypothetical protein VIU11_10470 [Nakamurella sp.]
MPDSDHLVVTVHGADGAGTVGVRWTGSTWAWSVRATGDHQVQEGERVLSVRDPGPRAAVRVLIGFLLAAADQPIDEFTGTTTEWATQHRAGLQAARGLL